MNEKFKRPDDSERKVDESMMRKMKESQIWVITEVQINSNKCVMYCLDS